MLYVSKIWSGNDNRNQKKYTKIHKMDSGYTLLEEIKRNKLKMEAGKRAIKYEEK